MGPTLSSGVVIRFVAELPRGQVKPCLSLLYHIIRQIDTLLLVLRSIVDCKSFYLGHESVPINLNAHSKLQCKVNVIHINVHIIFSSCPKAPRRGLYRSCSTQYTLYSVKQTEITRPNHLMASF